MAQSFKSNSVAPTDCLTELSALITCLAAGPQRFQSSGPWIHRSCHEQEGGDHSCLSSSRCKHASVSDRSLSAQPQLCERDCGWKTARTAMARNGCRDQTLCCWNWNLGVGQQRSRRPAGCGNGVRWRRANARDIGGSRAVTRNFPRTEGESDKRG